MLEILGFRLDLDARLTGCILVGLVVGKLIATAISIGLSVPGSLIGPSLVRDDAVGGPLCSNTQCLALHTGSESFDAIVGKSAMVSACEKIPLRLRAPLNVPGRVAGSPISGHVELATLPDIGTPASCLTRPGAPSLRERIISQALSAVLSAPLAALFDLLELTTEPNIIFPGMMALVYVDLVARHMLGKESGFEHVGRLTNPSD